MAAVLFAFRRPSVFLTRPFPAPAQARRLGPPADTYRRSARLRFVTGTALFVAIMLLLPGGLVEVAARLRPLLRGVAWQRS
jgi:hypothetical protein